MVPSSYCDVCTEGGSSPCNTNKFYSVYAKEQGKETLIGCFKYVYFKTPHTFKNLTFAECFNHCRNISTQFMAFKKGFICLCGNEINIFGHYPYEDCLEDQLRFFRVYKVVFISSVFSDYDYIDGMKLYHFCLNDEIEDGQLCKPGACVPGWKGGVCDVRDCSVANGNCPSIMECVEEKSNRSQCFCRNGFVRSNSTRCTVLKEKVSKTPVKTVSTTSTTENKPNVN
ncbi:hypothetical protein HELRODRAFT_177755 [Helobdella robusta]|uniref:EGF-like domain-containing protein n=1 Tax=Helobdella robusta TaxID=6412 RepID=T1FC72_HELRO|nr:hypothetical protein HELRODRAFT_177755 [Helobdella robusta]ESN97699.1 hypothetical protein HELRODRAFT_177755 [Helobdella robusta]